MLDRLDYEEPRCPLCSGKDFYDPPKNGPLGRIPVARVLEKADRLFDRKDTAAAGRLLCYWRDEAVSLRDGRGELAMESELVGYYRKQGDRTAALAAVARALALAEQEGQGETVSGATVLLNCATAYKAFGMAREAMPLYRRAERIYQARLPMEDERFGGLYNNMALAMVDLLQYEDAENAYYAALSVMKGIPGGEGECAATYVNMAYLYEALGTPREVERCMQRAQALLQQGKLERNGKFAFVLEKCAPAFGHFGAPETEEEMKKEAARIYAGT